MELHLKKNAAAEIMFPMVDSATPASLKSGVAPVDTAYSKDGAGAWAALAITDTATEIGATGMYTIELTAGEMNHDLIMIKMAVAGAADSVIIIRTFTNNIDSTLTANVTQIGGVAQSATDLKDFADTGYDPAAHKVQGVVLTDTCTTLTGHTPQTGDSFARLGAPAGVSVSADIAAIEAQTDDIGVAGAGLTALGDARLANLDATVSSRLAPAGTLATVTNLTNAPTAGDFTAVMKTSLNASTPASVTTVTGNVNGNVTGSVGSVVGHTPQTGDSFARLGAPAGASVSADILAIDNFVDELESHLIIRKATISDIAPTTTVFDTTLTEATNNYWNNGAILFTAGANAGVIRAIKDYDGAAKELTLNTALPVAPSNGDAFSIIMARAFRLAGLEAQEIRDAMKLAPTAGAPAAGSVDLHLDDIETDTAEIGAAGAGLTALGDARIANLDATVSTRATPAQVNTEVDTALSDVNLDHLVGTAVAIPAVPAGTYIDQMMDDGVAAYDRTTDSLQAIRDRGDAAWSAAAGTPSVLIDTTVAVVTDQTHFTLTAGSDIDDAYNDQAIVLYDASNANYPSVRKVSDYTGATKTIILDSAPSFTIIAGDGVKVFVTGDVASLTTDISKVGKKVDRNFVWLLE